MDSNPSMRAARDKLLALAGSKAKLAVFFGPYQRATLGKHSLQALQSTVVRNGIRTSRLSVYFDQDIFQSITEATRLHRLFHFLRGCRVHAREDSRIRLGIQVADAVAHSFGQILKEELTGKQKLVDIGGEGVCLLRSRSFASLRMTRGGRGRAQLYGSGTRGRVSRVFRQRLRAFPRLRGRLSSRARSDLPGSRPGPGRGRPTAKAGSFRR